LEGGGCGLAGLSDDRVRSGELRQVHASLPATDELSVCDDVPVGVDRVSGFAEFEQAGGTLRVQTCFLEEEADLVLIAPLRTDSRDQLMGPVEPGEAVSLSAGDGMASGLLLKS
jgi:hypothetical protein